MRRLSVTALAGTAAALAVAAPPALAGVRVKQLVVQADGSARQASLRADKTHVHLHGTNCAVPSDTALAALVRSDPPGLELHDYGSCSSRAQDAAGLFVRAIDGDVNRGMNGWVYKVGHRLATAGAADPSGPFGNGRLEKGTRVTWFYCFMRKGKHGCQTTLAVKLRRVPGDPALHVHVTAYDDNGHGKPAGSATVYAGQASTKADRHGNAELVVPPGHHKVYATKLGAIRSFGEEAR